MRRRDVHGPDRWEHDQRRQAVLERLGWTFYRLRGSAFSRDRQAALAALFDRLEELRITPVAAGDVNLARP